MGVEINTFKQRLLKDIKTYVLVSLLPGGLLVVAGMIYQSYLDSKKDGGVK